jgi:hypothetical protein
LAGRSDGLRRNEPLIVAVEATASLGLDNSRRATGLKPVKSLTMRCQAVPYQPLNTCPEDPAHSD